MSVSSTIFSLSFSLMFVTIMFFLCIGSFNNEYAMVDDNEIMTAAKDITSSYDKFFGGIPDRVWNFFSETTGFKVWVIELSWGMFLVFPLTFVLSFLIAMPAFLLEIKKETQNES